MKKKKVVIIGGTGFIGSNLTAKLKEKDNFSLSVIYKKNPPQSKITNVKYYDVDQLIDNEQLNKVVNNTDCLILLHQPDISLLQQLIITQKGIKKIIYASTLLLYKQVCCLHNKDSNQKQDENSSIYPLSDYEIKKAEEEKLLSDYAQKNGIDLYITRLANVYGDIKNRGIIQILLNAISKGEKITINGDGTQIRDYIFIEDVVAVLEFLTFAKPKKIINIFNICSGEGHDINEIISTLEKITKKKLSQRHGPPLLEKNSIIGENKKIIEFSRIHPQFSLYDGLVKTYENYLKD